MPNAAVDTPEDSAARDENNIQLRQEVEDDINVAVPISVPDPIPERVDIAIPISIPEPVQETINQPEFKFQGIFDGQCKEDGFYFRDKFTYVECVGGYPVPPQGRHCAPGSSNNLNED